VATSDKAKWIEAAVLILVAVAYCTFIAFLVSFTISWGGTEGMFVFSPEVVTFWLIALSPIPVLFYCIRRLRAIARGERPRN